MDTYGNTEALRYGFYSLRFFCVLVCVFVFTLASVQAEEIHFQNIPLPVIKNNKVTLRVAYVDNERIDSLSRKQINELLSETQRVAKEHFNIELDFTDVDTVSIQSLFEYLPEPVGKAYSRTIYDFKNDRGNKQWVKQALLRALKRNPAALSDVLEFSRPYLLNVPQQTTIASLADALLETMLHRIQNWKSIQAKDGRPLLDESVFNEYSVWVGLGYGALPYDLLLTNQPLISIEYSDIPVHSTLRGGITVGNTAFNKHSELGSFVVLSTFVFTNRDGELNKIRDGSEYNEHEAMQLAGAYLVHEIGHMLFHLGHPFGRQSCIMTPAELLHFKKWYRSIDANQCGIGSYPEMAVGSASNQMLYNINW